MPRAEGKRSCVQCVAGSVLEAVDGTGSHVSVVVLNARCAECD